MYKVNITDILKEVGKKKIITENISLQEDEELYKLVGPVRLELIAENIEELVLVSGQITAEIEVKCIRCDNPVTQKIEIKNVEQEYNYEEKLLKFTEEDKNIGIDELRFIIDEKGEIDLDDLIKQEIILALPLKPICNNCHNAVSYSTGKVN